ncbi:MAG: Ohr family peroxiredoxin [Paracoccaceae bacterium]
MPTSPTSIVYSTSATATGGGRNGHSQTDDGTFSVDLTVPREMGGPGGDGPNPEKLFATGYAACFMGALRFYAGTRKIAVPADTAVNVSVGIGPRQDTGFALSVGIKVSLPGLDTATAEDLIAGAHKVCPYSHAVTVGLSVTPELA